MHYAGDHIERWRESLESQGCDFVWTVSFRDPLDRFMSNVQYNHLPKNCISDFIHSRQNWQSHYFLHGNCGEYESEIRCGYDASGMFTMTTENVDFDELKMWIDQFDIISKVDDLDNYRAKIYDITGWDSRPMKTRHKTKGDLVLTRAQLKQFVQENELDYKLYYSVI